MQAGIGLGAPDALPKKARTAAGLLLGYLVVLWAGLSLTTAHHAPLFWLADAVVAAMVVALQDSPALRPTLALAFVCALPLLRASVSNLPVVLVRDAANLAEGALCGWLALKALGPRRRLRNTAGFLRLQVLAVLPAALANAVGDLLVRQASLRLPGSHALAPEWRAAFLPHLLGLAIALPAVLLLIQPPSKALRRPALETLAIVAGLAAASWLAVVIGRLSVGGALAWQSAILLCGFGLSLRADHARLRKLLAARVAAARDARRCAVEASRAKSEFLAAMSHEIRTPMNSILGFTQALAHSPGLPGPAREQAKMIAEAGGALMTMLDDMFDLSKVEAGQIELHLEPVELGPLLSAVAEMMREPAAAKGLTLRLETDGLDGATFNLDGRRLRQVLLNLLNNAVKFTDEGHILLSASLDPGRETLRFEVSDTGVGIEEGAIGRLFARFSQADSSTTRRSGGPGLGLAICKGLVERMDGRIGVDSRPGRGSSFWFALPAHPAAAPQERQAERAPAPSLTGRVLLVDDHPTNLRLGETLLRLLGCEVDLAASGLDAVEACRAQVYDVILMDVHMPGMDGVAAAQAIRALDGPGGRSPIVAMSADVTPQTMKRCAAAGMAGYLAKPVGLQGLHDALASAMTQERRRSAAA